MPSTSPESSEAAAPPTAEPPDRAAAAAPQPGQPLPLEYARPGGVRLRTEPPPWAEWIPIGVVAFSVLVAHLLGSLDHGGEGGLGVLGMVGVVAGGTGYVLMRVFRRREVDAVWKVQVVLAAAVWVWGLSMLMVQSHARLNYWWVYNQTYGDNYDKSIPWLWISAAGVAWAVAVELAIRRDRRRAAQQSASLPAPR